MLSERALLNQQLQLSIQSLHFRFEVCGLLPNQLFQLFLFSVDALLLNLYPFGQTVHALCRQADRHEVFLQKLCRASIVESGQPQLQVRKVQFDVAEFCPFHLFDFSFQL